MLHFIYLNVFTFLQGNKIKLFWIFLNYKFIFSLVSLKGETTLLRPCYVCTAGIYDQNMVYKDKACHWRSDKNMI